MNHENGLTRGGAPVMETRPNGVLAEDNIVCYQIHHITSRGIFYGHNPLNYSSPLLMLQIFLASMTILITNFILKPLGQPFMLSQIIGGIILGIMVLGSHLTLATDIFPLKSLILTHTVADFGAIFYLFLIGVQMDPWMIVKSGKKSVLVGISVVMVPLILSGTCSILINQLSGIDIRISESLPIVGAVQSMAAFPTIACYLSELKIFNLEFSRVALSSSMISGLLSFSLVSTSIVARIESTNLTKALIMGLGALALVMGITFILRPIVLWIIKQNSKSETMKEEVLCAIFLGVVVVAFISRFIGLHILFGPFIFGLAIPAGPPLGSAIVQKLNFTVSWILMPLFYVEHGLRMRITSLRFKNILVVEFIVLVSCIGKFMGALLPALYCRMPCKDALSLGLTMNVQGVIEISLFHMLKEMKFIDNQSFVIMCTSMLFVTGGVTPLLRAICNSLERHKPIGRRTLQHLKPNTELRILVCVHNQDNVPVAIHLLKASNPTKESPISVNILHLVELVGRATPLLIPHKVDKRPSSNSSMSQGIINVFRRYEEHNPETISVQAFTAISSYATMHNDVCALAFHKKTSIIILPYHKQLTTGSLQGGFRTVNRDVLNKAPCSVGILVDRGLLGGFKFIFASWLSYHVVVLFLGGADYREALAYGVRMSEHPSIRLTVIRLIADCDANSITMEKKLDDEMVSEFNRSTEYNGRVKYIERMVANRLEINHVIQSMENNYELIIVGRCHTEESPLMFGLVEQNKNHELGTIGDMFVSSDLGGNATVLVVQQLSNIALGLNDIEAISRDQSLNLPYEVLHEEVEDSQFQDET